MALTLRESLAFDHYAYGVVGTTVAAAAVGRCSSFQQLAARCCARRERMGDCILACMHGTVDRGQVGMEILHE